MFEPSASLDEKRRNCSSKINVWFVVSNTTSPSDLRMTLNPNGSSSHSNESAHESLLTLFAPGSGHGATSFGTTWALFSSSVMRTRNRSPFS
jgi:hypothetical protein